MRSWTETDWISKSSRNGTTTTGTGPNTNTNTSTSTSISPGPSPSSSPAAATAEDSHPVSWPQLSAGDQGPDGIPVWFTWTEKFGLPALLASYVLGVLCRWLLAWPAARNGLRDALLIDQETHAAAVRRAAGREADEKAAADKKGLADEYAAATAELRPAVAANSSAAVLAVAGDVGVAGRAAIAGLDAATAAMRNLAVPPATAAAAATW